MLERNSCLVLPTLTFCLIGKWELPSLITILSQCLVSETDVRTPVIVRWKDGNGICEVELLNVSLRSATSSIVFGFECKKRGLAGHLLRRQLVFSITSR
jgi:hypothetical protein